MLSAEYKEHTMAQESLEELLGDLMPRIEELQEHRDSDDEETEELVLHWLDELFVKTQDAFRCLKALTHPKVRRLVSSDLLGPSFTIGTRAVPFLDAAAEVFEPSEEAQLMRNILLYDKEMEGIWKDDEKEKEEGLLKEPELWHEQELHLVVRALARHLIPRIGGFESHAGTLCQTLMRELDWGESKSTKRLYEEHPQLLEYAAELVDAARAFNAGGNRPDLDFEVRETPQIQEQAEAFDKKYPEFREARELMRMSPADPRLETLIQKIRERVEVFEEERHRNRIANK